MISSLLHIVGLRPRVYYTLTIFLGGGGGGGKANTPMLTLTHAVHTADLPTSHTSQFSQLPVEVWTTCDAGWLCTSLQGYPTKLPQHSPAQTSPDSPTNEPHILTLNTMIVRME